MKLSRTTYIYSILIVVFLYSCSKNEYIDTSITQTYIEFPNTHFMGDIHFTETPPYTLRIPIQIFGTSLSKKDSVRFTMRQTQLSIDIDTTISISPNQNQDTIHISFKGNAPFSPGVEYSSIIQLHSLGRSLDVSANTATRTYIIQKKSLSQFLSGSYSCFETSTNARYTVTFTAISATQNTIINHNFWDFPLEGQTVAYTLATDGSNTIEIAPTNFTDKLGNTYLVYGSGTYDTSNGSMTVDFFMEDAQGNMYQNGTHIFTRK